MSAWNGAWHPLAQRFPMLSEEELRRMAESIAEAGQLHPCLVTPDGLGLDGRNRVAACKIAGVEPAWSVTEADPVSVIIAGNVRHRHMTTAQQAMATAVGMEAQGLRAAGRWKYGSVPDAPDEIRDSTKSRWRDSIAQAGTVLDHRPDLADAVLSGALALDNAYQQARAAKDAAEEHAEKFALLPADLAALVETGVRNLDDALAEAGDREAVEEIDQVRDADEVPGPLFAERARTGTVSWREARHLAEQWHNERYQAIRRNQDRIRQINNAWAVMETVAGQLDRPYVQETLAGLTEADREAFTTILNTIGKRA